jgi:hypothetical protein
MGGRYGAVAMVKFLVSFRLSYKPCAMVVLWLGSFFAECSTYRAPVECGLRGLLCIYCRGLYFKANCKKGKMGVCPNLGKPLRKARRS